MNWKSWVGTSFLWICFFNFPASAKIYPWTQIHKNDIQVITNPNIEAELRLRMIRKATQTIDIISFDQTADKELGLPLLAALKEAADRGVKIRYMSTWMGVTLRDPLNKSKSFLRNPPTKVPVDYRVIGGIEMWQNGWGPLDNIHEKLLIVDKETVLVTGRGHVSDYLNWLDTCFVMKGYAVDQSQEAFEQLWNSVERESTWYSKSKPKIKKPNPGMIRAVRIGKTAQEATVRLEPDDLQQLQELSRWLDVPAILPPTLPDPSAPSVSEEFYSIRLLHFDFLDQMRTAVDRFGGIPSQYSWKWRIQNLDDSIVEVLIPLILKGKDLQYFTLSSHMNPKLKAAILIGIKNGLSVRVMTNSKSVHTAVVPVKIPFGWYAGLEDLNDMVSQGARVFGLVPRSKDSPIFLHRKVAAIDDTVIFGSHNFNISSTVESDEMSFQLKGGDFADRIRQIFDRDISTSAVEFDPKEIHDEYLRTPIERKLADLLAGLY